MKKIDPLRLFGLQKNVDCFEDKVVSLLKPNTSEDYSRPTVYGRGKKLSKLKIKTLI